MHATQISMERFWEQRLWWGYQITNHDIILDTITDHGYSFMA